MAAQSLIRQEMSLNKALRWCGVTRKKWYYKPKAWEPAINLNVLQLIRQIREERPFYCTRRMAAELSRMLNRPVNRKLVRRVYRQMGWSLPAQDLNCAKAHWTPNKAARPNRVWEMDITYVWCDPINGWCYCFNVLDIFTRQWIAYRFDTLATADVAVELLVETVAVAGPDCSKLTPQCDNGSQYAGKKFRKTASILGISLKFIRTRTHEQNGHIEAFPGTLKYEYIWPHDFQLPADRGRHSRSVPGLQPEQAALGAKIRPAGRVPRIVGGGA